MKLVTFKSVKEKTGATEAIVVDIPQQQEGASEFTVRMLL